MFSTFRTKAMGAAALALAGGFAAPAEAAFIFTMEQVGNDVAQKAQALTECRTVRDAGGLFGEHFPAAGGLEVALLSVEAGGLICGGGAGVADEHRGVAFVSCLI